MTMLASSTSPVVSRVERGVLILTFLVSVGIIGVLTFYYERRPSLTAYAFTGGTGELWLTVIAISALGALLIFSFDERQKNEEKDTGEKPQ
jgi:hypothetical protein